MKQINLLPKNRQNELYYEVILRSAITVLWLSVLSFAVVFLAQLATKFYLQSKAHSIEGQITDIQGQVDKAENAKVKQQIALINGEILDYKNLADSAPKWSKVLKAFAPLPPSSLKINSLVIDPLKKSISINGLSPTRDAVLELYNNIRQDEKEFYNIDYPLENLIKPTDVNFHFTFYIKDDLLK